jgi:hypothetical protein
MELKVRALVESDLEILHEWWKAWGWPPVTKDLLPLNGLGGLMVYKHETLITAGFLYLTNSKVAWLEWIVSNPDYRESDRKDCIKLLISSLEEIGRQQGYNIILSVGRNQSLLEIHRTLGYTVDEKPSYEITKKIQ